MLSLLKCTFFSLLVVALSTIMWRTWEHVEYARDFFGTFGDMQIDMPHGGSIIFLGDSVLTNSKEHQHDARSIPDFFEAKTGLKVLKAASPGTTLLFLNPLLELIQIKNPGKVKLLIIEINLLRLLDSRSIQLHYDWPAYIAMMHQRPSCFYKIAWYALHGKSGGHSPNQEANNKAFMGMSNALMSTESISLENVSLNSETPISLTSMLSSLLERGQAVADNVVCFITPINLEAMHWAEDPSLFQLREERIEFIKTFVAAHHVPCLDLHMAAPFQGQFANQADWFHLNGKARALLADELIAFNRQLGVL